MREMRSFVHAGVSRTRPPWRSLALGVVAIVLATLWVINAGVQVVHAAANAAPQANAYTYDSRAGQRQNPGDPSGSGIRPSHLHSGNPASQHVLGDSYGAKYMGPAAELKLLTHRLRGQRLFAPRYARGCQAGWHRERGGRCSTVV